MDIRRRKVTIYLLLDRFEDEPGRVEGCIDWDRWKRTWGVREGTHYSAT